MTSIDNLEEIRYPIGKLKMRSEITDAELQYQPARRVSMTQIWRDFDGLPEIGLRCSHAQI
jgi:hypothetical protein